MGRPCGRQLAYRANDDSALTRSASGPRIDVDAKLLATLLGVAAEKGLRATPALMSIKFKEGRHRVSGRDSFLKALESALSSVTADSEREAARAYFKLTVDQPSRASRTAARSTARVALSLDRLTDVAIADLTSRVSSLLAERIAGPPWWRRAKAVWTLSGLNVLGVVALVTGIIPLIPRPPQPMSGEINVLIVASKPDNGMGSQIQSLAASADQELGHLSQKAAQFTTARYSVRVISTEAVKASEIQSKVMADKHAADVVVLLSSPTDLLIESDVYVDARAVGGAEELSGLYSLGAPIRFSNRSRAAVGGTVRKLLANRVYAITTFIDGLGAMSRRELRYAEKAFEATDRGAAGGPVSPTVVLVFLGNARLQLAVRAEGPDRETLLADAQKAYKNGLERDPGSSRLKLGLLTAQYVGQMGGCVDRSTSRRRDLKGALTAIEQIGAPESVAVAARIELLRQRTKLCLALVSDGELDQTHEGLLRLKNQLDTQDPALRQVVSEALLDLALIASEKDDVLGAERFYAQAKDLALDPYRKSVAEYQHAVVLLQMGRNADAKRGFEAARTDAQSTGATPLMRRANVQLDQLQ